MKADSKNKIHTGLKSSSIENIPKGWTTQEFGKTFEFLSTFSFSRDNLSEEKTKDEIRYIHYGDIHSTFENGILKLTDEGKLFADSIAASLFIDEQ